MSQMGFEVRLKDDFEPLARQYNLALDAESEKRLHQLLHALPAAVYTTDAAGRITFYNEAAAALWGCRPQLGSDEWCGSWRLFWPDGTPLPHGECPMAMAIKEKRPIIGMEAVAERPDGTRVPFMPFPSPLFDSSGKIVGAVNMLVDITERKKSEETLRRAEQELRDFVENASVGLHWAGPDGMILWANRTEMEMLGFAPEEYIGHHIAEFHADQPVIEDILRRLTNHETLHGYEARLRCKDGSIRHVLISSNVLWEGDKFVHTRCFTRDVTERKQAEEREREHQKQLIAELTDMRRLQEISTRLIQENNGGLYDGILDAAVNLMRSDMGSMQMVREHSALRLLAFRGFDPRFAECYAQVSIDTNTSCGMAFQTGHRIIVPDVETCDFIVGTPAYEDYCKFGIRAMQSTPLISRFGRVLGMISNHWREPHELSERELLLIDVLARQAADLIERKQKEEKITLLAREAEHRAKNVLATVQATVHLTQSDTPDGLKHAIEGRIQALANVHKLFVESRWTGADIHSLVQDELVAYSDDGKKRVHIDGPNALLEPSAAQAIAVTLHELATNAAKYGALSVPEGHVKIEWSRTSDGRLVLRWVETGGPPVKPPTRQGFGMRVTEGVIRGLHGEMRLDWRAEGLACEIALPPM